MRLTWLAFTILIPLYIWAGETIRGFSWLNFPYAGRVFGILAVSDLFYFFWARKKLYLPALEDIQSQPGNVHFLMRWKYSWTVLICMANSVMLFGFAFRMGGKTLQQSLPFYVLASFLILWLWPRLVGPLPK